MGFKRLRQICASWSMAIQHRFTPKFSPIILITLTIAGGVVGIKQLGWLQPLELRVYDRLVRLRPDEGPDPRLLVVAITEQDLKALNRSTLTDQDLAQALANLEQHRPNVIGLDLHRDVPQKPGTKALRQQLQSSNIVVITKLGNGDDESRIPPPPNIPPEQIGFNDLLIDPDGVIRRNLLFGETYYSFSLRLALHYLHSTGINPTGTARNYMQLQDAVFIPLAKHSGGYQTLDDRGYQILLNYRSQRHVAQRVTFTQVLKNQVDPALIRDKIVLIGTTAVSAKDLFYTPYSAGEQTDHQMAGVEVHAQMVSHIISAAFNQRSLIWFWSEWQEWLWVALWALLGSSLGWCIRHPLDLVVSSTGTVAFLLGACFIIFMVGEGWVPLVAPAMASLAAIGVMVAYRNQQAHRQQQMIMTLLGQNISPAIADALWAARDRLIQSGKLPGQQLVATMLFTDIKDFSSVAEQMVPEHLLDWLNEYLQAMTQVIQNYHGIINKFTGDGLLAVFGVPVARVLPSEIAQDAYNAVACALSMSDRLQYLNQNWQERGLPTVQMRVGIFTGPVVVGSLGGKDRMEYGVLGDSVNIAARLEGCAKERQVTSCRILIAHETLDYVREKFLVESWGPMALKGKQQLVDVYRVVEHLNLAISPTDSLPQNPIPPNLEAEHYPN